MTVDAARAESLSAWEMIESAGISYRQLDYYTRTGLLEATPPRGSGFPRSYAPIEVPVARLCAKLLRLGRNRIMVLAGALRDGSWVDDPLREVMPGVWVDLSQFTG